MKKLTFFLMFLIFFIKEGYCGINDELIDAARRGDANAVKKLIQKGADVNAKNNPSGTALIFAALNGHTEIVDILIKNGAEVNARNKIGSTALHSAAYYGHTEVVKILIENGADVNAKYKNGGTALHSASFNGHIEVVKLLIRNGIDINSKNKNGKTAFEIAKNGEIKKLLLNPESVLAKRRDSEPPPDLRLSVQFSEPSGNNILDGDEKGTLLITVENIGKGTAYDVSTVVEAEKRVKGLSWQNKFYIGDIPPGKKSTVSATINGDEEIETDKAIFKITTIEANGFDAEPVKVVFNTKSFEPPKLIVADVGIEDQNGNLKIEPLEMVETTVRVQNAGYGDAKNVVVDILNGENVFIGGDSKTHFEIGNLKVGEFKDIKFLFYTNKKIENREKIPLTIRLSEARQKFNGEYPLNLVLNAPQKSVTEIVVQGIDTPKKSIDIATGLSVDVDINIPKGMMADKDDIAVVIGNKNYIVKGVPSVEFADRGARIMKEYLITTFGFNPMNIIYEEDATLSKFNEIFGTTNNPTKSKLNNWIKKGVSRVFIFYTGHGAPDLETGGAYLMPVDADPQFITSNGYSLETFYSNLAQLPAKDVIVVLDACFSGNSESGMIHKNISPAMIKVKRASAPSNVTVITSAGMDQVSVWYREKRHSLFTYYFLKAIGGEADKDKDSRITLKEIKAYLDENVPYMSGRLRNVEQTPMVLSINPDSTLVRLVK